MNAVPVQIPGSYHNPTLFQRVKKVFSFTDDWDDDYGSGRYRDEVYRGNPFQQDNAQSKWSFMSFIYFADTDDLWIGGWGNNHDELINEHHGYSHPNVVMELMSPNTVFGQVWKESGWGFTGAVDAVRIDLNASDYAAETVGLNPGSRKATTKAWERITQYLKEQATEAGIDLRISKVLQDPAIYDIIGEPDLWKEAALPKKAQEISTEQVEGYTVIEMSSGEYRGHDAIYIDRENHRIMVNYAGHHDPMFQAFPDVYMIGPESYVAGHWRLEHSDHEPFPEGWGWHNGRPSAVEMEILQKVLKRHYKVDKLEQSFYNYKPEDEQLQLFEGKYIWLDQVASAINRPNPWQAAYLPKTDQIYITNDPDVDFSKLYDTILEGFYTKIESSTGPHVGRAREIVAHALAERYPTSMVQKLGYSRWIIDRHGTVTIGDVPSHTELLERHFGTPNWEDYYTDYVTGGYITDNGTIEVVRCQGEPEFNPEQVAYRVYEQAANDNIRVSGKVRWEDITSTKPATYFEL